MSLRTQILGIVSAIVLFVLVFELVRREKLRTGYALLWMLTCALMLTLVVFKDLLVWLSWLVGIESPEALLFTAGIGITLLILLEHSLTLTRLWRQNKCLAQDHALLACEIRQITALLNHSSILSDTETETPDDLTAESQQTQLEKDLEEMEMQWREASSSWS